MTIKQDWLKMITPVGEIDEWGGGINFIADGAIAAKDLVYFTGAHSTTGRPKVKKADADAFVSVGTPIFIARGPGSVADGGDVVCDVVRILTGVNTSGSAIGNPVFPSGTAGGWSLSQGSYGGRIGTVLKVHASTGVIFLHPQIQAASGASSGLNVGASSEVTIASGAAALTGQFHTIDTESDAASDDLDTLSGLPIGGFAMLKLENAARNVVIRDTGGGTGNIRTPGAISITLDSADDHVMVFRTATNYIALTSSLDDLNSPLSKIPDQSFIHHVRAVVTANVADLGAFTVAHDGITLAAGERVLLAGQSTGSQNGIYVVGAVAIGVAPLTRATDFDTSACAKPGTRVHVSEGTAGLDTVWELTTNAAITLGTTALVFAQVPASAEYVKIAAILAENADVLIPVSLQSCFLDTISEVSGAWTLSRTGTAAYRIRRTAAGASEVLALSIPTSRLRTTALKGLKITGFKIQYEISAEVADDVTVAANRSVFPANGAAIAAATTLGAVTYDAAHDTAGERGAVAQHTMQGTFASPAYLADGFIELLITVNDTTGGNAVFDLNQVALLASETLVDAA